jgi:hypothetical protein
MGAELSTYRIDVTTPKVEFSLAMSEAGGARRIEEGTRLHAVSMDVWNKYAALCGELADVGENSNWGAGHSLSLEEELP